MHHSFIRNMRISLRVLPHLSKISAKVVTHARYVTFQMVEVAVLRELFPQILGLWEGDGVSQFGCRWASVETDLARKAPDLLFAGMMSRN